MDVRVLRYFLAVAELGNLSRAARQVRISQPALSRQMLRLEQLSPTDDEDLLFEERDDLETALRKRVVQAREIDEAAYEPVADVARIPGRNPQRDAWKSLGQAPGKRRYEDGARSWRNGQRERAGRFFATVSDLFDRLLDLAQDDLGALAEAMTGIRQRHAVPAPKQERPAELLLETQHLSAQCRLADPHLPCRPAQIAELRHSQEVSQYTDVHRAITSYVHVISHMLPMPWTQFPGPASLARAEPQR